MSDTIAPGQAFVLSVGIERYAYGHEMDLPGAGAMAVRFAEWALRCGIPAQRVILAATWVGQTPQMPDGVKQINPTYEALRTAIVGLREVRGDLLLIFWCGHGVLDLNDQRSLYSADATRADKRNIHVDEMLRYLGSDTVTSFPQQVVLIDACANYIESMGYDETLPREHFPAGNRRRRLRQFSFFSAAQGQIADYKKAQHESAFSVAVLDWLEQYGSGSLPPDLGDLTRDVLAVFDEKRHAGELQAEPVYLWVHAPGGSEIKKGEMPVSEALRDRAHASRLSVSQVRRLGQRLSQVPMLVSADGRVTFLTELDGKPSAAESEVALGDIISRFTDDEGGAARGFAVLHGLTDTEEEKLSVQQAELCWRRQIEIVPLLDAFSEVTFQQVRDAFFAAMPPGATDRPRSLTDALEMAADRLPVNGEETALHRLVARLEHTTGTQIPDKWYGLAPDRLNALRQKASAERAARGSLVVDLRNLGGSHLKFTWPEEIHGHLRMPDGDWSKTTISCESGVEAAVSRLLDDAHERELEIFTIGFIVPRAAFDLVPESWAYGNAFELPTAIWRTYPTVLHCGDRLSAPPKVRAWWTKKAAAIKAALVADAPQIRWLHADSELDPPSISQMVREASEACFGLAWAPGPFEGDMKRDPIIAMVAGGAPFLIWVEHEPPDWDVVRERVVDLIDSGNFDELPDRLRRLRVDTKSGLEPEIRLLWDEPNWLPPFGRLSGL